MRKLAVMAALLAATGVWADEKGSTGEETKEAGQAAARDTKKGAEHAKDWSKDKAHKVGEKGDQAKDWSKEQANKAGEKTDQAGDRMQTTAQESNRTATTPDQQAQARTDQNKDDPARERMKKDSFDIEGKVSKASGQKLTLNREDAPAATLHVDKTTKIELDGEKATLSQLRPGQDVKASFNLQGEKAHAIEIKAEKQDK